MTGVQTCALPILEARTITMSCPLDILGNCGGVVDKFLLLKELDDNSESLGTEPGLLSLRQSAAWAIAINH